MPVDDDHGGVHIEHKPPASLGPDHPGAQPIVEPTEFREPGLAESQEKAPQRRGVRIGGQTRQGPKDAIARQQVGRLQTFQSEEHRVQQRQQHLPNAVPRVALREPHVFRERLS